MWLLVVLISASLAVTQGLVKLAPSSTFSGLRRHPSPSTGVELLAKKKDVESAEANMAFKAQELKRSEMARRGLQKSLRKAHMEIVKLRKAAKEQGSRHGGASRLNQNPRKENFAMASTKRSSQSLRLSANEEQFRSGQKKREP